VPAPGVFSRFASSSEMRRRPCSCSSRSRGAAILFWLSSPANSAAVARFLSARSGPGSIFFASRCRAPAFSAAHRNRRFCVLPRSAAAVRSRSFLRPHKGSSPPRARVPRVCVLPASTPSCAVLGSVEARTAATALSRAPRRRCPLPLQILSRILRRPGDRFAPA
jgi:hypothetical protein